MSLEAIERITKTEEDVRAGKAAAEAESRAMKAEAQRAGEEMLLQLRQEQAAREKELLAQAEARGAQRGAQIAEDAASESRALREKAEKRLPQAVEFIVERVVKN